MHPSTFRGYPHGVFITGRDKNKAQEHIAWLKATRGWDEGIDFHWCSCLSGPMGPGEEFYFAKPDDAVYFKLARGGSLG